MKTDEKFVALFNCDCSYYHREYTVCRHCHSMFYELLTIEKNYPDCLRSNVQLMCSNIECTKNFTRNVNLIKKHKGWLIASLVMNG